MDKGKTIRERLLDFAKRVGPECSMLAQVVSVDEGELTCTLYDEDSEAEFYDVRLRPVIDGNECLTIIPKVDTWVLAVRIEDSEDWLIVAVGEADKWCLKVGEAIIEQTAEGLLIKKQDDTLRQVLELIIQAVQKIVVMQGTNPDYPKLTEAMNKAQNLLR